MPSLPNLPPSTASLEEQHDLLNFLKHARPEWSVPRRKGLSDAARVVKKLQTIGVTDTETLVRRVGQNTLNQELVANGEVGLSREAINSIRKHRPFIQALEYVDPPHVRQIGRLDPVHQMLSRRSRNGAIGSQLGSSTRASCESPDSPLDADSEGHQLDFCEWKDSLGLAAGAIAPTDGLAMFEGGSSASGRGGRYGNLGVGTHDSDGTTSGFAGSLAGAGLVPPPAVLWTRTGSPVSRSVFAETSAFTETFRPRLKGSKQHRLAQSTGSLYNGGFAATSPAPWFPQAAATASNTGLAGGSHYRPISSGLTGAAAAFTSAAPSGPHEGAATPARRAPAGHGHGVMWGSIEDACGSSATPDAAGSPMLRPSTVVDCERLNAAMEIARTSDTHAAKWTCRASKSPLQQGEEMLREQRALDLKHTLIRSARSPTEGPQLRRHIAKNIRGRLREEAKRDAIETLAAQQRCLNVRRMLASMANSRRELHGLNSELQRAAGIHQLE